MRAGLLREILIFKELKEIASPSGFVKKEYVPILTCRACRRKLERVSKDDVNAMENFSGCIVEFQIRYNSLIKENQRVTWQGRNYEIKLLDFRREDNSYIVTLNKLNT